MEGQVRAILNSCDQKQLEEYLHDNKMIDTLIQSLDIYQSIMNEKESLMTDNQNLAELNLHKEPLIEELKIKLSNAIKSYEEAKEEYVSARSSYEAQMAAGDDMSLPSVLNQLHMNATRSEEDTDKFADDFFCNTAITHTDDEINVFQRQFIEQRTQAHILKIKAEKMKEQLPSYLIK